MLCEDLTSQLQWTAGFQFCLLLDTQGPPPLTRIVRQKFPRPIALERKALLT